jgi:hypothetical protein
LAPRRNAAAAFKPIFGVAMLHCGMQFVWHSKNCLT